MYCVIANRELFNRIGFLKEFPYAGTEAEEFAYRMRSKGFKQGVCGSSWVHHIGGATLKQYENDKKVNKILRNTYEEYLLTHKNTNDNNI
jgi:GT2 family glycosyltransferase